jgi:hypothetical protein
VALVLVLVPWKQMWRLWVSLAPAVNSPGQVWAPLQFSAEQLVAAPAHP